ncbi:MAG: hypothetical protein JNM67_00775 [Bacteroidetes bacterium]|nr:hypothetical protein [Bacteroidota bacterium]
MTSCDPGLSGDLKVFNEANQALTVKYTYTMTGDTMTTTIPPNSHKTIKVLGGLGSNKTFDCCPCVMNSLEVKSPQGKIKKDPNNSDNWSIPNKKKLKKFGGQDVKCEFHVIASDL